MPHQDGGPYVVDHALNAAHEEFVTAQLVEITVIWVSAQLRGQGLGARLMTEAETEARQRGCRFARAATSNFQAPGFYDKLGYQRYGRLQDCPPGETVSYYWKPL